MKRIIYQYMLPTQKCAITVPKESGVLDVMVVEGNLFIWMIVNPDEKETELRHFISIYNGEEFETPEIILGSEYHKLNDPVEYDCLIHIRTVRNHQSGIILHVFEVVK